MKQQLRTNCGHLLCTAVLLVGVCFTINTGTLCVKKYHRANFQRQIQVVTSDPKTVQVKQLKQSQTKEAHQESKSYHWTRVTTETENAYGNYLKQNSVPFEHCRPGQCRIIDHKIEGHDSMWKLTEEEVNGEKREVNLANLVDVLNYFPGHIQQTDQKSSCNIFFVGDSLTSDHAMAASCQLHAAGYNLKSHNLSYNFFMGKGEPGYGNDINLKSEQDLYPGVDHVLMENPNAEFCPEVLIIYAWGGLAVRVLESESMQSVKEAGGVIVYSVGVHCNEPNSNCISDNMNKNLLPMVNLFASRWRILLRETEPQHFITSGGAYPAGEEGRAAMKARMKELKTEVSFCVPTEGESTSSWRNQEAADFLHNYNLTSLVKTIPIHSQLIPLWQLHFSYDCTHYCYDPYRFDVTWDGMLKALSSYEDGDSSILALA